MQSKTISDKTLSDKKMQNSKAYPPSLGPILNMLYLGIFEYARGSDNNSIRGPPPPLSTQPI